MESFEIDCVWNVMAHAQKTDFVFRRNGRVHLNRRGRQFSRLLASEVCASAVVMLDTPCSEVLWRVLATHSIRQYPLRFPSRATPCAITFQLDSTTRGGVGLHVQYSCYRTISLHIRVSLMNSYVLIQHCQLSAPQSELLNIPKKTLYYCILSWTD